MNHNTALDMVLFTSAAAAGWFLSYSWYVPDFEKQVAALKQEKAEYLSQAAESTADAFATGISISNLVLTARDKSNDELQHEAGKTTEIIVKASTAPAPRKPGEAAMSDLVPVGVSDSLAELQETAFGKAGTRHDAGLSPGEFILREGIAGN